MEALDVVRRVEAHRVRVAPMRLDDLGGQALARLRVLGVHALAHREHLRLLVARRLDLAALDVGLAVAVVVLDVVAPVLAAPRDLGRVEAGGLAEAAVLCNL